MTSSNLPVLLFLVPFVGALACAALGWQWRRLPALIALTFMAITAGLAVTGLAIVATRGPLRTYMGGWQPPLGIEWVLDPLGSIMAALVGVLGLLTLAGCAPSIQQEMPRRQSLFYACALLLVSGLMGMALTGDLFNLFVHLELASLSAYALVAAGRRGAPRAAISYLFIGSIGASLYLLGIGFLYAATGTLNMADVAARLSASEANLQLTGIVLVISGLGVKMGLFPLHVWLPDAYTLGPAPSTTLMAPLATKLSAYALLRILYWVYQVDYLQHHAAALQVLCWGGALAMVFGGVKAAVQQDLWRLLAYSTVSQVGLVALGIGLATSQSLTGAILQILNDAVTKAAMLTAAAALLSGLGIRSLQQLPGLVRSHALCGAVLVVGGMSLLGIPPLPGFYAKWYILLAAIDARQWAFVAAILLGTLATALYVFRIVEMLYFTTHEPRPATRATGSPGALTTTVHAVALALALAAIGLLNGPMVTSLIIPALPRGLP